MASTSDSMLYLYTSLTAGSSHIITATSRLETILKAHKIPFRALDCATDEKARMLWGRRAKGRKLPGLVKFGNVIGDLEQVEEWNEFGELKDQMDAVDFAGVNPDAVKSAHQTSTLPLDVPKPEPKSDHSSRASSQGRHISISEPTQEEIDAPAKPKSPNPMNESPMNLTMQRLGAEAAAKGAQRKISGTIPKVTPMPTTSSPTTAQTPTPATAKAQESDEAADAESTAAKTPALLAAEGKTKTSTGKIEANTSDAEVMPPPSLFPPTEPLGSSDKSTQEQVLLRRTSTQTKQPSRLSEATPAAESHKVLPEEPEAVDPETTEPAAESAAEAEPAAESTSAPTGQSEDLPRSSSEVLSEIRPRSHRGSSLEEADKEEIRRIEERNRIKEEEEGDSTVDASKKPQETKAKDADAAGVSVGD